MLTVVFVDLFSLYRPDIEACKVFAFDIGQSFLSFSTLYLVTIVGLAIGEWNYYILGGVLEAALLAMVIHHAWTWPQAALEALPAGSAPVARSSIRG